MTIHEAVAALKQTLEDDDRQLREHPFYSKDNVKFLRSTPHRCIHVSVEVLQTLQAFLQSTEALGNGQA